MSISGRVSFWLNLVLVVLSALVAGGPHMFPAYVPPSWAEGAVQTAAFAVAIMAAVNAYLHQAGGAGVASAVVKTALAALCVLSILAAPDARADSRDLLNGLKKEGKLPQLLTPPMSSGESNVFVDIATWVGGDLTAAETLATQDANLQDWTGKACWQAAEDFAAVLQAHPAPVTLKAATDAEALRLLTAAAKRLCQNAACQTVSADLLGGIAQMGLGVPAPVTLQTLCAKIPSITLGTAPTATAAPADVSGQH